ncbi:MAG: amidase [Actinobacteria bacterium]|nr:amidase [Actinomycetota bacterium]
MNARSMAAAVAAGETSAVELVREALARLEAWQPVTNAFTSVRAEAALAEAEGSGRSGAAGRRPLLGVPVAVKDLFDVAGLPTTGCSRAYEGRGAAGSDAELVRRLRAAGAIVVGKTNQHELAAGSSNLVSACGPTRNPWDPARITGGSSGGSGAAVAAGVVPIALGTDTGGSIRMPSSLCGCWGLKPTYGRLPRAGMMPLAPSLDCPGPMAASADDLALWWEACAAEGPVAVEPARGAGVLGGWFRDWTHPEVWAGVERVAEALPELGLAVRDVVGDGIEDVREVWTDVAWAEFAGAHGHLLDTPGLVLPPTERSLRHGASLSPERLEASRRRAAGFEPWYLERMEGLDLLVCPATPIAAPVVGRQTVPVGEGRELDWVRGGLAWFTEPVNLAGLPALSVPSGRTPDGLPVGVQLVGRRGSDEMLLAVAAGLEALDGPFRTERPPLPPEEGGRPDPPAETP